MTEARIKPVEPPWSEELSTEFSRLMPPGFEPIGIFRTIAHNPRVLKKIRAGNLLDRGSITRREREIVILRACARCGAEYEWGVHVAFFAERFGITREQVQATLAESAPDDTWSREEALLVRLVDELHETANITDALWSQLEGAWRSDQLVELVILAGFYHTISFVTNGFCIALEEGVPSFSDFR